MLTLAVLPTVAVTVTATLPMWPWIDVTKIATMQALAGALLIECALFSWTKVPFACGHAPSPDALKAWWPVYTIAMYLFAFRVSDWQHVALDSTQVMNGYVATMIGGMIALRLMRHRRLHQHTLEFDAGEASTVEQLKLSEALN